MGKVRIEMVKRLSHDLIKKYPYSFNNNFQENKEFLNKIELDTSKKLRNRIAGYITTIINQRISFPERIEEEELPVEDWEEATEEEAETVIMEEPSSKGEVEDSAE